MTYAFGDYELDTVVQILRQAGVPVLLAPQVYQFLAYLIRHRDRVVYKDELLQQLWPHRQVDASAVKRCIMAARRAIGDAASAPQCIKTLHGQGYRFIATVREVELPPARAAAVLVDAAEPTESSSVLLTCPHCGQDVLLPAAFCRTCGQPLGVGPAPALTLPHTPPPTALPAVLPAPLAERKLLTALCCHVANATHLLALGLDATYSLLDALCRLALEAIRPYDGTMQHISSHGFLALFGAPVAQEDHAQRAVRAALALQQRLQQRPARLCLPDGAEVAVSLALHTGLVALGPMGAIAPGVAVALGEPLQLVARLARQAAPGTLVASATTMQCLQEDDVRAVVLPAGAVEAATMPVYQIVQGAAPHGPGSAPRQGSPFVGREADLAVLQARLTLAEGGQGQVVGVVGEPGIGKSRLLAEFRHSLSTGWVRYMQARCQSYGCTIPCLPYATLHQHLWEISRQRPCVLAIENLHWIDAASEAYLVALVERLASMRLLLLVTFRPGYRPPWSDKSYVTQIALQPLSPEDSRRVLQAVPGHTRLIPALVHTLVARAAGNPLFLEELAGSAVRQGVPAAIDTVPHTIQALMTARLDRLPPADKRVLQAAAVIAVDVSLPVLQAMTGLATSVVQQSLSHLQTAELLHEVRRQPQPTYRFTQSLMQEVIAASLLEESRHFLRSRAGTDQRSMTGER